MQAGFVSDDAAFPDAQGFADHYRLMGLRQAIEVQTALILAVLGQSADGGEAAFDVGPTSGGLVALIIGHDTEQIAGTIGVDMAKRAVNGPVAFTAFTRIISRFNAGSEASRAASNSLSEARSSSTADRSYSDTTHTSCPHRVIRRLTATLTCARESVFDSLDARPSSQTAPSPLRTEYSAMADLRARATLWTGFDRLTTGAPDGPRCPLFAMIIALFTLRSTGKIPALRFY